MAQDIVNFLKKQFPKKWYSIRELQQEFSVSRDTIYYWIEKFEIPTFKINSSPFIVRENLINFLLKSNKESYSKERLVGFEFILEDLARYQGTAKNGTGHFQSKGREKVSGSGLRLSWKD